jgi:hypothetical protein
MGKFFSLVKARMRERDDAQTILGMPLNERPILAYAEDDYTWNQLGPYLSAAMETYNLPVVYVTSDPNDPRLTEHEDLMSTYMIRDSLPAFLPSIDSPVFFTTMPDLNSFHLKAPQASTKVYAFHSLNSIHMAYRANAFDAYDVFFCVGPHHHQELERYFEQLGRTDVILSKIGYPKLDRIAAQYASYRKSHPEETTVLIAPSWGENNVLAAEGAQVVEALSDAGYRTVIRPHPAFFESIYPEGEAVIDRLKNQFGDRSNVVFETSITSENSFMEADVMISDWSGAAFEYALGTERPVLFIDLPPKVKNPDWNKLGLVPFEDRMREQVGALIAAGNSEAVVATVADLIADRDSFTGRLANLRIETVYNPGSSAEAGSSALAELAGV